MASSGTATSEPEGAFPVLSPRQLLILCAVLPERPARGAGAFDIAWSETLEEGSRRALHEDVTSLLEHGIVHAIDARGIGVGAHGVRPLLRRAQDDVVWLAETGAYGHVGEDMQALVSDSTGDQLREEQDELYGVTGAAGRAQAEWTRGNVQRLDEALAWVRRAPDPDAVVQRYTQLVEERACAENRRIEAVADTGDQRIRDVVVRNNVVTAEELLVSAALAIGPEPDVAALRASVVGMAAAAGWVPDTGPFGAARDVLFPVSPLL